MVKRNTIGTGESAADEAEVEKITPDRLRPGTNGFAGEHLLSFVERIERLTEEHQAIGEDRTECYNEAKAMGFDAKILRKVIARRKMDTADRDEADAIEDLYESALAEAERKRLKDSLDEAE
jgi:uncharacterized protein (UPF0335 family)